MPQNKNVGCFPCPSIEQRNLLAIQRNSEAIAALTVSVQELSAKDVNLQAQIDEWSDTLDRKIVDGYRRLFEPDMQAERTARENADETLSNRIGALETLVPSIQTTFATKADLSAVKEALQDEDIRLNTKIVNGDDAVKEILNQKVSRLSEAISGNTASIEENSAAITNEKAAREDADNSIRADVDATVGQIYATLRGEMEGIKTLLRNEFGAADTALDGKIAAAVARIEALEPVLARVGKLETDFSALETKVNGFYHLTEEQWDEAQEKIAENAANIESQGSRIDLELNTLRDRVTEIERILINR